MPPKLNENAGRLPSSSNWTPQKSGENDLRRDPEQEDKQKAHCVVELPNHRRGSKDDAAYNEQLEASAPQVSSCRQGYAPQIADQSQRKAAATESAGCKMRKVSVLPGREMNEIVR